MYISELVILTTIICCSHIKSIPSISGIFSPMSRKRHRSFSSSLSDDTPSPKRRTRLTKHMALLRILSNEPNISFPSVDLTPSNSLLLSATAATRKLFSDISSEEADNFVENKPPKKILKRAKVVLKAKKKVGAKIKVSPSIPLRVSTPKNGQLKGQKQKFETVKQKLHVAAVMDSLPCREKEISDVLSFVKGKLVCKGSGCMYISGVPGTGKTATVREVSNRLLSMAKVGELPKFKFIEINGLRLTEPRQAYVEILKQLTGEKTTATKAADILNNYFCSGRKKKEITVLLADELDLLWTRKQSILYNLFDWPSHSSSKLIVLAIANTMNLPERLMMGRVSSRMGLTRLDFHPYTFTQLKEIITTRLTNSKIFDAEAIELASRKVASVSGDARRALDICRRAVEIGGQRNNFKGVTMKDVSAAVEEMFTSPRVTAIRNCSPNQKLFLEALSTKLDSMSAEETTLEEVLTYLGTMCKMQGVPVISMTQGTSICTRLVSTNLVLLESGRGSILRRVRLNVTQDDIHYALHKRND